MRNFVYRDHESAAMPGRRATCHVLFPIDRKHDMAAFDIHFASGTGPRSLIQREGRA